MISVEQALTEILSRLPDRQTLVCPLADSLGCVLAQDIQSDIDSPPYDKSLVDGYAVVASDIQAEVELSVLEEIMAGQVPTQRVRSGTAIQIMTGAPLPEGADAVVMIEDTTCQNHTVVIHKASLKPETNVMRKSTSLSQGDTILKAGTRIRPIEMGILAEVGCTDVPVYRQPELAVISTGDELVPATTRPAPGQIRNSNGPLLIALGTTFGAATRSLGIGLDDFDSLSELVAEGLKSDVLVLSGGVSAGVKDLVPGVLAHHNVEQVFHKVRLKPGKPLWFGLVKQGAQTTLVFGLPGNPVSSLVCFLLFVAPVLQQLLGVKSDVLPSCKAQLTEAFQQRGDRPTYFPASLTMRDGTSEVTPLNWKGSADQSTLSQANGLAFFPAGEQLYAEGSEVTVFKFPS